MDLNEPVLLTPEGLEKLKRDLEVALKRRAEAGERLKEAFQPGDIEDNPEYEQAKEEVGLVLKEESVALCHTMYRHHRMPEGYSFPQIDLYFTATDWEGNITNCEPEKCDELKFYPLEALPSKTEEFICHALACWSKKEPFSEFGWS